jgi:integrase
LSKQWKQVKVDKKDDKKSNIYDFGNLKSKNSNREVPIPLITLNELKKCSNVVNIDNRIFKFKNTDSTSICVNRLLKRKGYDITIHELRHTYATMLISNGVDFKTAAKLLGHTVQQTMKVYSHVNDDMMKRATGIIENIF